MRCPTQTATTTSDDMPVAIDSKETVKSSAPEGNVMLKGGGKGINLSEAETLMSLRVLAGKASIKGSYRLK